MNKFEKYIRERGKKNTRFLIYIILSFLLVFFISRSYNQKLKNQISTIDKDMKKTSSQISSVKNEIETTKKDYENRNTDAFKEKIAREKLGMVKKGEYVYKDNNNK